MQEYERRFEAWLENLKYVHDYNARHTSHWVSAGGGSSSCSI